jgi:hypothetical protein
MSAANYITERVDEYKDWYDKKAVQMKPRFLGLRMISTVGSVLVPIAANARPEFPTATRIATTVISLMVSVAIAFDSVYHFGDQWKNYRATEQFLSREKFLFVTGEGPYRGLEASQAHLLLVERCEAQIASENSATLSAIITAAQKSTDAPNQPVQPGRASETP